MSDLTEDSLNDLIAPQVTRIQIYCGSLYDLMDRESVLTDTEFGKMKIWKGYTTKACDSIEIPTGVRNRVVARLTDLGCIQLVEQGRRNRPSVVTVFYPPTPQVWASWDSKEDLTDRPDPAKLEAAIKTLQSNLRGVDVAAALHNLEQRLQHLEIIVNKLNEGNKST